MSSEFWACRAGSEFLAAIQTIARESKEKNKLIKEQNELIDCQTKIMREQIDVLADISEALKYLR